MSTHGKATANSVETHFHLPKPASGNTGMMPPQQRKDLSGQNASQLPHGCGCDEKQEFEKYAKVIKSKVSWPKTTNLVMVLKSIHLATAFTAF